MVDIRAEGSNGIFVIRNDAMVNTLYASRDGVHVITGDAQGMLKVWDIRSRKYAALFQNWGSCSDGNIGTCISSTLNDPAKMPISHITIGRRRTDAARRAGSDILPARNTQCSGGTNTTLSCWLRRTTIYGCKQLRQWWAYNARDFLLKSDAHIISHSSSRLRSWHGSS